jgi:hypothetical protein
VQLAASSQMAVNLFIQNTSEVSLGEIRLPASDEDRRQVVILQDLEILTIGTGKDNRIKNLVKNFMYKGRNFFDILHLSVFCFFSHSFSRDGISGLYVYGGCCNFVVASFNQFTLSIVSVSTKRLFKGQAKYLYQI